MIQKVKYNTTEPERHRDDVLVLCNNEMISGSTPLIREGIGEGWHVSKTLQPPPTLPLDKWEEFRYTTVTEN
jgi:hypothetical protein